MADLTKLQREEILWFRAHHNATADDMAKMYGITVADVNAAATEEDIAFLRAKKMAVGRALLHGGQTFNR